MADGSIVRAGEGRPFKASGRDNEGRFDFFVLDVGHLTGPPLHVHEVQEDTFYVTHGIVTVQLGDDVIELAAGDYGTAAPGVPHTFTNAHADQDVCRVVNLMTPGIGFDRYIEEINALAERGADAAALGQLAEQYGVEMVGPPLAVTLGLA